ncbi:hypothetical protein A3A95_01775 [Candidatus Nomurabacteria bacterium RIFCSPLOWO2_01_FULL_39_18]|uniref:HicB-like antitoxin of toxin-antitoxin system domain-containing protein n=1 Tax=Candidatus Nomurabacteria bacterium RIFCSPHIGHO2_01_FULL_40_24b TaxID=1801739 RepID=A0A1F6V9S9_9BACT|nr:MAG: hypothetical protein A2647_00945 [Candidatus Nomurabacteria bacterium RIFCSPHIGHO2_01_FULL_40_24b]OGI90595.1 MAG: hypothetical protein A3A95_01775 [Candidatus Nomurabacteria bacterium RIFCSPLOWO2_01_FULL_39_18]
MKKLTMKVTNLPITIFKEGKSYIAYSPALDLSTSASTYKKAQVRFSEIVAIFFEELTKMGTVDPVLAGLGWQKIKSNWQPPVVISSYVQKMNLSYA